MSRAQSLNRSRSAQRGVMLIEVLVAILIFAVGVLGLIGLQSNAVRLSSQAQYRAEATMLANELVGQMWLGDSTARSNANLTTQYSSSPAGTAYTAWKSRVTGILPGSGSYPPTVVIAPIAPLPAVVGSGTAPATGLNPSSQVTITVRWKHPSEPSGAAANSLVLVTEIK